MLIKPPRLNKVKYTGAIVKAKTKEEFDREKQRPIEERIGKLIQEEGSL